MCPEAKDSYINIGYNSYLNSCSYLSENIAFFITGFQNISVRYSCALGIFEKQIKPNCSESVKMGCDTIKKWTLWTFFLF